MATSFKWETPAAIQTLLSTELNSLANSTSESTGKVLSGAIDNLTNLKLLYDWELVIASITTGSGQTYVALWVLYEIDGSNYEDGSTTVDPGKPQEVIIPLKPSHAGAQRVVIPNVPIAPFSFKILLQNKAGAALAESGNSLKYRAHNEQGV